MTDIAEPPPSADEEEHMTGYEALRHGAPLIFAAAAASVFVAIIIYALTK
jgi:hypothetical protein